MDLFASLTSTGISVQNYLICAAVSLLLGAAIAFTYTCRARYTQSFVLTLILLPVIVQTVILLVNGNVGTGVAVAGAFSLVRFRSVPGNAKDIAVIFLDGGGARLRQRVRGDCGAVHAHRLRDAGREKAFLDALRCRNGNLEVRCGRPLTPAEQL